MTKTITLRYNGKCRKCGEFINKGNKANWLGKGHIEHVICHATDEVFTPSGFQDGCKCIDYPCCGH